MSIYEVRDLRAAWMAAGERLDAALKVLSEQTDNGGTYDPEPLRRFLLVRAEYESAWNAYRAARRTS